MPICENCGGKWSWKQTVKKSFTLDTGMECPHCGKKQYQTVKSKKRSAPLLFIVTLPLLLNLLFDIPGVVLLSLFPVIFVVLMSTYSFLMELSDKEEFMF
ncbi:TIGR04104 family putative zinc finger protein [Lentibacillus sediminis]|uniref:TIGR04104 family putative zinc finger protein n=1 Tax=Lentibacillus sediminis TaxID=1940529 RepID=UPI000C1C3DDC|nr:TIGR04104 family putative zinc finger protein [Lentibacillus sediminis]